MVALSVIVTWHYKSQGHTTHREHLDVHKLVLGHVDGAVGLLRKHFVQGHVLMRRISNHQPATGMATCVTLTFP